MRRSSFAFVFPTFFLLGAPAFAQHAPHQEETPFPYRCPRAGVCLQTSGTDNVFGGVRHGDDEIRFHAIYKPDSENPNGNPYCVIITDTNLDIVAQSDSRAACKKLDQNDSTLFGVKPTTKEGAKRVSKVDAATYGCIEHIAAAESQPDNQDAWSAVQDLAGRWLKEQQQSSKSDDNKADNASDGESSDTDSDSDETN